jgi:hypothetical protein
LRELLEDPSGWSITGDDAAAYVPGGEWSAVIRLTANPNRRLGTAHQTRYASTPDQAVQLAERLVNG